MDIVWDRGHATVRDVIERFDPRRAPAYTTLMTIMTRLAGKGLLEREPSDRAYDYHPTLTRTEYNARLSRARVRGLIADFGDIAVAQFAEELSNVDPERARRLEELLRRRRR